MSKYVDAQGHPIVPVTIVDGNGNPAVTTFGGTTGVQQVNLYSNLAGEDFSKSATGRILMAMQDGVNPAQLAGISAGGQLNVGAQVAELTFTLPTLNTKVVNTASLVPTGRIKAIWVVVTTALTWVTTAVPTMQIYGSRVAVSAGGGATTALPLTASYLGAAQNMLAATGTTITLNNQIYLSANAVTSSVGGTNLIALGTGQSIMNDPVSNIGVEFTFGSALTAGAMTIYLECSGT